MRIDELKRLEVLEQLVRALARDVESLRMEIGAPRSATRHPASAEPPRASPQVPPSHAAPAPLARAAAPAAPPPPSPASPALTLPTINIEQLVGRYGTVVLGATVILAGVGVLISWAVAQGLFGPHVRLALAVLLAVTCGVVGWQVRQRSSRRFGDVLLALALALSHLVAWGAGPALEVVSPAVAFGLAAIVSMAMAGFASAEKQESLFTVGIGGALLAPFVTLRGDSSVMLLVYGAIIVMAAMLPLRRHRWLFTAGLLIIAVAIYAGVSAAAVRTGDALLLRAAPFAFVLLLAAAASAAGSAIPLAHAFLLAGLLVAHPRAAGGGIDGQVMLAFVPLAIAALLVCYATIQRQEQLAFPAALIVPAGTLLLAATSMPSPSVAWHAVVPLLWAGLAAGMGVADAPRREVHALVAAAAGLAAVGIGFSGTPLLLALVASALVVVIVSERAARSAPWRAAAAAAMYVAVAAAAPFAQRAGNFGVPFRSADTLAAAALVAGVFATSVLLRRASAQRVLRVVAVVLAFFWIRFELALAISADVATFSLILYYAAAGMAAITVGRQLDMRHARHAGLAMRFIRGSRRYGERRASFRSACDSARSCWWASFSFSSRIATGRSGSPPWRRCLPPPTSPRPAPSGAWLLRASLPLEMPRWGPCGHSTGGRAHGRRAGAEGIASRARGERSRNGRYAATVRRDGEPGRRPVARRRAHERIRLGGRSRAHDVLRARTAATRQTGGRVPRRRR